MDPVFEEAVSLWHERNPANESETETSVFELLVRGQDYVVSEDLGFIRLTAPVQEKILAVSYALSERGRNNVVRSIGQLSVNVIPGDTIHLKLIKPSTPSPSHPTWPLAFKNVYYLGATDITREGFNLKILYRNGALGNNERDKQGKTFLQLFGLDSFDEGGNRFPDDFIDTTNINIINLKTGELIFPMLHPFEMDRLAGTEDYFGEGNTTEELKEILPDSAAMYRSLSFESIRDQSQFEIKVSYQNRGSTINLGGFALVEGSEEVYRNNERLKKGEDYLIDYFTGTVTFLRDDMNQPDVELEILFDKHQFVSFDKKTIVGTRAQMDLGPKSFMGVTALFYNQSVINEKVEVGYEPTRNFIWDLNGRYESDVDFLTRAIDRLPLIETKKPSSFRIEGEFAQVLPNPNPMNNPRTGDPNGVAFIDDFEGAKRITSFSVRRRSWYWASPPSGFNRRYRTNLFWYNPYTQVRTRDIWPNQATSRLLQNERMDILVLNVNQREAHRNIVPSDSTWAAVMTPLYSGDYNQSETKFFEIWLKTSNRTGKMTVDLGLISEDQNGNGILDTEDRQESLLPFGNSTLEEDEDVGLDGCEDAYEDGYGGCLPDTLTYEQALLDPRYHDRIYMGSDLDPNDPNGDNYAWKWHQSERPEEYRHINGTEGNGFPGPDSDPEPRYPDSEDLNRDSQLDRKNDYFTATFDLDPNSPDSIYIAGETTLQNGAPTGWRLYRIPVIRFERVKEGGKVTWDTIKFMRLALTGIPDSARVLIAKAELVGNEWQELGVRSPGVGGYVKDDSAFAVTVVNTEDSPGYAQAIEEIGVQGEYDRVYQVRHKEQSLVLRFNDLKPREEGAARKTIEMRGQQALSYLSYSSMKMFVYGNSPDAGKDSTDVEFFMRFGHPGNFYEIRQPVYREWDKRNLMKINLGFLVGLKDSTFVPSPGNILVSTDSTRTYIEMADGGRDTVRQTTVRGSPALSRIQYFIVGVRNTNPSKSIGGEVWLDELRLSGVRKDAGTAVRVQSSLSLADVGSATITYSRRDADFHVLQNRLGTGKSSESVRLDGRLNVNKFFPESWGLSIPLGMSYSGNIATPKYLPGTDIPVQIKSPPDSVLTKGRQIGLNTSFSKSSRSDWWVTRYTLDRLKTDFSATQSWNSDSEIRGRFLRNYSGGASYSLGFGRDNYWSPLRFLKGLPWLGTKLGDTHLYYTPSSFDLSVKASETLSEINPRVGQFKSQYNLGLSRNFKLAYKILENLNANYSKAIKSDMDRFRGRYFQAARSLDPGTVTDVTDNLSTSFTPTIFSWFRPSFNYSTNYRWSKSIESTREGAAIRSQVRFSSSVTLSPKAIMETVYSPPKAPGRKGRRGRSKVPGPSAKGDGQEGKEKGKNGGAPPILKTLYEGANRINPISIIYSESRSQNAFDVLGTARLPYRFGLEKELGLEHSAEAGVNRISIQRQKDLSLTSGLSLTRKVKTSLSYSTTKSWGLDGNNVRTESETRNFFPRGIRGDEGSPFVGWGVRWSGVESWPLLNTIARSASLEHAFAGKETRLWQNDELQSSRYSTSYSPLVGVSMTLLKGITFSTRYSTARTVENRFRGINSTKVKIDRAWSASSNYAHRGGLSIPVFFFRDFNLENTINFSLTFDFSESVTMQRNDVDYDLSTTKWRKGWKISPRISYSFSRFVTGGIWYEYRQSDSKVVGRKIDRDFGFEVNLVIQG
ncbi:MAG: cell surface protein SprA [Fidelibacterota bacterium]